MKRIHLNDAGSGDNHYVLQLQRSSPLVEGEKMEEADSKRSPMENGSNGPGLQLRAIGVPLVIRISCLFLQHLEQNLQFMSLHIPCAALSGWERAIFQSASGQIYTSLNLWQTLYLKPVSFMQKNKVPVCGILKYK